MNDERDRWSDFLSTPIDAVAAGVIGQAWIGRRFRNYEIVARLGAGGMGEVYRARDHRLGRDVAIKVLPASFVADRERLARFEREARVLATLNDPHIASIYDVEEIDGATVLVLELVDGETLADRIARGPIPMAEALPIARQIAEALEAAHEKGIVHRDIKPSNIALSHNGTVKVLDFGLAKPNIATAAEPSQSPTFTLTAPDGVLLGTAAYMSPEQARGQTLDKRTDIWAFGCVLYEMLTGHMAFPGETMSDHIAAILERDADWKLLPAATPPGVRALLRRCLDKDPKRRLQAIGDARVPIEDLLTGASEESAGTVRSESAPRGQRAVAWTVAGALAVALAFALWAPWRPAARPRVTRMTITPTGPAAFHINGFDRDLALSPDGTHVVYVGNNGHQLFVRALDVLEPVAIASGANLLAPFVSPDGQWVGFASDTTLRKIAVTGGPPITLTTLDGASRGVTCAPDDTIIFATANPTTGLQRVSAAGGTPEVLTRPDHADGEADHLWPEVLPGGHAVLFTITSQTGGLEAAQVAVRDLRTGIQKVLVRGGSDGHYLSSGHLVYVATGSLRAIPFDLTRLETQGTAMTVLPQLATGTIGQGEFAVATDGTLVYTDTQRGLAANAHTVVWVNRAGKEEPLGAPARAYQQPRLSPDGTRVVVSSTDQEKDLWVWDLQRATLTRLTDDPDEDVFPVWTPDSRRIIFSSTRGGSGVLNLWSQAADGTGAAERLTTSSHNQAPTGLTPDGTSVIINEVSPTMGRDVMQLTLDGTHRVMPLLQTKFDERHGVVSPDGRWLAYESNSSGRFEIYVRPFADVPNGGHWEVSTAGGTQPLWARNGKELFYLGLDGSLLRVPVEASGATWKAGTPTKLLDGRYVTGAGNLGRSYDVSPDGQRFLMIKASGNDVSTPPAMIIVQHWDEEVKRLVPPR